VLGEQLSQHRRVLIGDRGAELRQHAGGQVEAGGDRIEVASARPGAGPDQHFVRLAGGYDLLDQRIDGGAPAVDHALAADLDHIGVRKDAEINCRLRRRDQLGVGQRALHQQRLELGRRACHRTGSLMLVDIRQRAGMPPPPPVVGS
jgi:hypothetical protein